MLTNEVVDVNIIANNETGQIEIIENKIENNVENKVEKEEYISPHQYFQDKSLVKK